MRLDELAALPPHGLAAGPKGELLTRELAALTAHHRARCADYRRLLEVLYPGAAEPRRLADVPHLPIGLFKSHRLQSVPDEEVVATLSSSGTSGQAPSRVVLDRETAERQRVALARVMTDLLGPRRLPLLVLDSRALLRGAREHGARAAAVLGMTSFGRDAFFALDEGLALDREGLARFLARHGAGPFLVFGFTFLVWRHLGPGGAALGLDLSQGTLVHGGGWKRLQAEAVDDAAFKRGLLAATGLRRVHDYYGTIEQAGGVSVQCAAGHLHPPSFADVLVRDPATWEEAPVGAPGPLQLVSLVPTSYPGHSLLTDDLGVVHGVDDCPCGWLGKRFSVLGRAPRAEARGCSDVRSTAEAGGPTA